MTRSRHLTFSRERFMQGGLAAAGAATGAWLGARPAFGLRLDQARSRVQEFHFVAGDGASTSDLPGLDFITSGADLGIIAASNFQMGLLYLGGDGSLYNGLAQSYSVSDDLLTYTFTLAPGLRWSDGSPFTARDVKYSWNRMALPETKGVATGTVLIDLAGIDDVTSGQAQDIAGVQALDDHTVVATLKAPNVTFPLKMAHPWGWSWVKQSVFEHDPEAYFSGTGGLPLGVGPFKIDAWLAGDRLVFSRNPYYHLEPANLDTMHFLFNRDVSTLLVAYENNELDLVSVDSADVERFNAPGLPHYSELKNTLEGTLFLAFKVSLPPMDDPLVRLAFYQAVDRNTIGTQVFRTVWRGVTSVQPPDFSWYNQDVQWPAFDPAAARDALARSKYGSAKNLPKVRLADSSATRTHRLVVALQQMWKDNLGVDVDLKLTEFPYEAAAERRQIVVSDRGYPWADVGWMPFSMWKIDGDRNKVLSGLIQADGTFQGVFQDADLDRMIVDAETTVEPQDRIRKYEAVERRAMQDMVISPLFHQYDFVLVKPWVMDYTPKPIFFDMYGAKPSNVWIADHR